MAKKPKEECKSIFRQAREDMNLTREKASERLGLTSERIVRIESEEFRPYPDEVLRMAEGYKRPDLCNYFCSQVCDIGRQYVPQVSVAALSQIVLEILVAMNAASDKRDRLLNIAVDGVIHDDELEDFVHIQKELERISVSVEALQLWSEKMLATGKINLAKYNALMNKK